MNFTKSTMFFALSFLAIGSLSHASSIKVDRVAAEHTRTGYGSPMPVSVEGYTFEINQQLGRARLEINYTDGEAETGDNGAGPSSSHVLVPGLSFDKTTSSVILTGTDSTVTICATVKITSGLFGQRIHVKKTGNCFLTSEITEESHDDGFRIYKSRMLDVYLATKK